MGFDETVKLMDSCVNGLMLWGWLADRNTGLCSISSSDGKCGMSSSSLLSES